MLIASEFVFMGAFERCAARGVYRKFDGNAREELHRADEFV